MTNTLPLERLHSPLKGTAIPTAAPLRRFLLDVEAVSGSPLFIGGSNAERRWPNLAEPDKRRTT
jgi:hypothetical protein